MTVKYNFMIIVIAMGIVIGLKICTSFFLYAWFFELSEYFVGNF